MPQLMSPNERKSKLVAVGVTQREIARITNVSEMMVSHVVHGRARSQRVERTIAKVINAPVERVFPKRQRERRAA